MYRYVEQENIDGVSRMTGGVTRKSLDAMRKHLHKIRTPHKVVGYVYRDRVGIAHAAVKVEGSHGTIRFGGFLWGYGGTGPCGLNELFAHLGIQVDARSLSQAPDFSPQSEGVYWVAQIDVFGQWAMSVKKK